MASTVPAYLEIKACTTMIQRVDLSLSSSSHWYFGMPHILFCKLWRIFGLIRCCVSIRGNSSLRGSRVNGKNSYSLFVVSFPFNQYYSISDNIVVHENRRQYCLMPTLLSLHCQTSTLETSSQAQVKRLLLLKCSVKFPLSLAWGLS